MGIIVRSEPSNIIVTSNSNRLGVDKIDPRLVVKNDDRGLVVTQPNTTIIQNLPSGRVSRVIEPDQVAGEEIYKDAVVATVNDKLYLADNENPNHLSNVVGLALNAGVAGSLIQVLVKGTVTDMAWNLDPRLPIFLGNEPGSLTYTQNLDAYFGITVGYSARRDRLFVRLGEPIQFQN